jgi:hypothetical protein
MVRGPSTGTTAPHRLLFAAAVLLGAPLAAAAAEPPTAEDYLRVLVNGPWPLEMLAYCYSTIDKDAAFQQIGVRWRARNDGLLGTVEAKALSVAIPADVRRQADEASLAAIRRLADRQYDKAAWCRTVAAVIDRGDYDLDRRSDLEDGLKRIFGRD